MAIANRISPLILILLGGLMLRFWNLALKPLWMDEVITGVFSFGRTYTEVPLAQAVPVAQFQSIFAWNPATCAHIAQTVAVQSVHPPLFFCWMHRWLGWLQASPLSSVWQLRSLPVFLGVIAIALSYALNTLIFSRTAGWISAGIMAVSPFAVYLSQEARHYTAPMVLVLLALIGLYPVLLDIRQQQWRLWIWLGWIGVNSLGFYVHYFFLLAFVAQALILLWETSRPSVHNWQKHRNGDAPHLLPHALLPLLAIALVLLTYLPWLPTLLSHMNRPETDWVKVNAPGGLSAIAPLLQLVSGWTLATIALPVEGQPVVVAIAMGSLMAVFSAWLVGRVGRGLWQWGQAPATRLGTRMLVLFTVIVMLEFLAIAYLLGKDFTQVPRYNFIYFPGLCALIGAGLSQPISPSQHPLKRGNRLMRGIARGVAICDRRAVLLVLCVSTLSSVLVVTNQVFQKPYQPDQVAQAMLFEPQTPTLVTMAYSDWQDVALGLSFGLELARQSDSQRPPTPYFAFLRQVNGYESVWRNLSQLSQPFPFPLNLWVIGPGLKRVGYRPTLPLMDQVGRSHTCTLDPAHHYRIGIPYQLYRCR